MSKIDKGAFKKGIENDRSFQLFSDQCKTATNDKEFTNSLIVQVGEVLKDKKESGSHKFYAMRLLSDCLQTYKGAIVNSVANAKELHPILKDFASFQKESNDEDRGATIFGKKEEPIMGIQFLQLVLEFIYSFAKKYPKDGKGDPTKLLNLYKDLEQMGVKFPSKFQYFPQPAQDKTLCTKLMIDSAQTQGPQQPKPVAKPMAQTQMLPQQPAAKQTPAGPDPKELKMRYIRTFESVLEDAEVLEGTLNEAEEPEEFIQEILATYNTNFQNKLKMLDKLIQEAAQIDNLFSEGESAKMFQLKEFLDSYGLQFTEMEQSGFLETSYKSFKFIILQQIIELQGKTKMVSSSIQRAREEQKPSKLEYQPPKQEYKPPKQEKQAPKQEQQLPKQDAQISQSEYKLPKQEYQPSRKDLEPEYKQTQSVYKQPEKSMIQLLTGQPQKQDSFNPQQSKGQSQQYLQNQISSQQQPTYMQSQYSNNASSNSPPKFGQQNTSSNSPPKFGQSEYEYKPPLKETNSANFQQPQQNKSLVYNLTNSSTYQNSPQKQTSLSQFKPPIQILPKSRVEDFSEKFDALSMSTMSVRDFPSKNQQYMDEKQYYGYLVPYDGRQFNELYQLGLSDNQVRRLKVACVKQSASVFESSQLQIGVITKLLLHEMTNRYFLKLILVFGNKTKTQMYNCQINYEGDYGLSLWTQDTYLDKNQGLPKSDDGSLDLAAKQQLYQPIVVHYNMVPFNCIQGQFSWQDDQNQLKAQFILPCLLPKFMNFLETDAEVFKQKWHYKKQQCLKSELVQLNSKIIRQPIFFKRYFPHLVELSSFQDFVNQQQDQNGNFKDFKLGGTFTLQSPKIEFMLKVIVRPNLTGLFKIIPYFSYQSQAEHVLHSLVFLFGHPN